MQALLFSKICVIITIMPDLIPDQIAKISRRPVFNRTLNVPPEDGGKSRTGGSGRSSTNSLHQLSQKLTKQQVLNHKKSQLIAEGQRFLDTLPPVKTPLSPWQKLKLDEYFEQYSYQVANVIQEEHTPKPLTPKTQSKAKTQQDKAHIYSTATGVITEPLAGDDDYIGMTFSRMDQTDHHGEPKFTIVVLIKPDGSLFESHISSGQKQYSLYAEPSNPEN